MKKNKNIKKLKINAIEIDIIKRHEEKQKHKKNYKALPEEQKQKRRDYQKQYTENMTDEQKQKIKDYRKEYYKRYYIEKMLFLFYFSSNLFFSNYKRI